MIRLAPAARAPSTAARPVPPRPMTATTAPGRTRAVLTTAPMPVITAHPNSAAWSRGMSGSMRTSERVLETAYSAKHETPTWWLTGSPLRRIRRSPESRVPATAAFAPGSHSAGRPSAHGPRCRSSARTRTPRDRPR